MQIKCLIFDFGGIFLNLDEEKTWSGLKEILDPELTSDIWDLVFHPFERGEISEDAFFNRLQRRSKIVLPGDIYVKLWNAMLLDLPVHRIEFLESLKPHYKIFLLSNTNITHLRKVYSQMNKAGILHRFTDAFDKLFFSHELKMRKPETRIYEEVLRQINFAPEHCLFVDDKLENTQAATSLGILSYCHDYHVDIVETWESEIQTLIHSSNSSLTVK